MSWQNRLNVDEVCILRNMKTLLIPFLLVAASLTQAQMTVPMPAEMKALSFLMGEWEGTMKMTLPGATQVMDVKSTVSVKEFGAYQETVYTMEMPGMSKFTGKSFLRWNPTTKQYQSWTYDTAADEPREETGTLTGNTLTMVSRPQGGMVTRIAYSKGTKDTVNFLIEMKSGDKFEKLGDCVYTRKK